MRRTSPIDNILPEAVDPIAHIEDILGKIERNEKSIHAFLHIKSHEELLASARRAARRIKEGKARILEGAVVALKDNIITRDMPTTAASRMLVGFTPGYDATVVKRLRRAGAIIIGKTNMDEFGMGSTTELSGFGPTRNPLDPELVPGGSSGGSAALLVYGGADLALGSDTGGSIRLPAAFTGIVGLKPTYGAVSRYGLIPYANSLEQIGPMARSVRALALLLDVISGLDRRDSTSLSPPWKQSRSLHELDPIDPSGLRICLVDELMENTDPAILKAIDTLVGELEENGAIVEEIKIPILKDALPAYYVIAMAEAASNLARYDGTLYPCGQNIEAESWEDLVRKTRTLCFGPEVKRRIMMGAFVLSEGYRDEYYISATRIRRLVREALRMATKNCIVASPVSPVFPPRLGERLGSPLELYALDVQNVVANLAGLPSLAQPIGWHGHLPVPVQWIGPAWGEPLLIRIGLLVEEMRGGG